MRHPTTEGTEPRIRPALLALLLGLLLFLAYLPALGGPFLWDDRPLIVDAPFTLRQLPLVEYFFQPFWQGNSATLSSYYRPLVVLSYLFDYQLHGLNPAGFHLTNVVLHACNAVLLYYVLLRHKCSPPLAMLACLCWGLLPRLTEAVAWISGRTDVLATSFVLLALVLHRPDSRVRRLLAVLSLAAGLLAKEVAVAGVLALMLVEYDACKGQSRRCRAGRLAPLTLLGLGYIALRLHVTGGATVEPVLGVTGRILAILEAVGRYLTMLAEPFHPTTAMGYLGEPRLPFVVGGAVASVLAAFLVVRRWRKIATETLPFLVLGALALGLVIHVVPLPVDFVAADRLLYLPSAASTVLVAPWLARLLTLSRWLWLGLLGTALALVVALEARIADYTDEGRFWAVAATHASRPNTQPLNELAGVFYRAGLYDEACSLYREAIREHNRQSLLYRRNLAMCLSLVGEHVEAVRLSEQVTISSPRDAKAWLDHGLIALHALDFDGAEKALERARSLSPATDQVQAALELLGSLARVKPEQLEAQAAWFARVGRRPEALSRYHSVLNDPSSSPAGVVSGAEYIVKFGAPEQLEPAVLRYERHLGPAAQPSLREAAEARLEQTRQLRILYRLLPSRSLP